MPLLALALQMAMPMAAPTDGAVVVTINPESRVSVARGANLPPQDCRWPIGIAIAIDNQAAVRSGLTITVDSAVASIDPSSLRLSGAAHQRAEVMVRLNRPEDTLISIAIDAGPATTDLAGRYQTDLSIRCR